MTRTQSQPTRASRLGLLAFTAATMFGATVFFAAALLHHVGLIR